MFLVAMYKLETASPAVRGHQGQTQSAGPPDLLAAETIMTMCNPFLS